MDLLTRRYSTAKSIAGPLLFIERAEHVSIGEMVRIVVSEKDERSGQVIEVSDQYAVIQVLALVFRKALHVRQSSRLGTTSPRKKKWTL